jgi:hypothetical protein
MSRAIFEWEAAEYDHNPKSADWYWAVGIVATALTIAALLFGNYLIAVLVIVAGAAVVLHALRHPPTHRFAITERGLMIGPELYPYDLMQSFSMLEYIDEDRAPILSIKTESWLSPHLLIPLEGVDADALYSFLLAQIEEEEHQHALADVVASWLGF